MFLSVQISILCYNNNKIIDWGDRMDNPTEVLTIQKPELPNDQNLLSESPEILWKLYIETKKMITDLQSLIIVEGDDKNE